MRQLVEIEDIEHLRLREGINDVELRREIRQLKRDDVVRITLLAPSKSCETIRVRITSIRGCTFRGKLASKPASRALSSLDIGSPITFAAVHIHSIAKGRSAHAR
jgi:hypothetical protein